MISVEANLSVSLVQVGLLYHGYKKRHHLVEVVRCVYDFPSQCMYNILPTLFFFPTAAVTSSVGTRGNS